MITSYRKVGNTRERDQMLNQIHVDMKQPWYPHDFDHSRASADLQSILDGGLVDAFAWLREKGRTQIPNAGYGWIMAEQLPAALHKLRTDPDTRQASVVFWNGQGTPSCTLCADFKIRDGQLNAVFFQRSSDESQMFYDIFNFVGITRWLWERLNDVELGKLILMSTSLHRY